MGYGNEQPNDEDVRFDYRLALDAARGLHALAAHVRTHGGERQTAAQTARHDWTGPKREQFDQKMGAEATDTIAVREKSRAQLRIKSSLDLAEQNGFPSWVEVDPKNFKGVFKALPDRAEFANDVNEQLVVEIYSK